MPGQGSSRLQSVKYERGTLSVLDQLKIPASTEFIDIQSTEDAWQVIKKMQVRGAPLIAMVAALGLAVEAEQVRRHGKPELTAEQAKDMLVKAMAHLRTSRPTAVDLFTATDKLTKLSEHTAAQKGATSETVLVSYIEAAEAMLEADVANNKAIGRFGGEAILSRCTSPDGHKPTVLTLCNTGSLATAGYGTALGVARYLHEQERLEHLYACETRPYLQGSRLTAFEIVEDSLPGTLIVDAAASSLMKSRRVDAVVVGADRVAANGDTANKIGTYQLAIIAKHHGCDFWVAAPSTSCDVHTECGNDIVVEERPAKEMRSCGNTLIAPPTVPVWNPAFDVAPADLITGIITEHGVIQPDPKTGKFDVAGFLSKHSPSSASEEQATKRPRKS